MSKLTSLLVEVEAGGHGYKQTNDCIICMKEKGIQPAASQSHTYCDKHAEEELKKMAVDALQAGVTPEKLISIKPFQKRMAALNIDPQEFVTKLKTRLAT